MRVIYTYIMTERKLMCLKNKNAELNTFELGRQMLPGEREQVPVELSGHFLDTDNIQTVFLKK